MMLSLHPSFFHLWKLGRGLSVISYKIIKRCSSSSPSYNQVSSQHENSMKIKIQERSSGFLDVSMIHGYNMVESFYAFWIDGLFISTWSISTKPKIKPLSIIPTMEAFLTNIPLSCFLYRWFRKIWFAHLPFYAFKKSLF